MSSLGPSKAARWNNDIEPSIGTRSFAMHSQRLDNLIHAFLSVCPDPDDASTLLQLLQKTRQRWEPICNELALLFEAKIDVDKKTRKRPRKKPRKKDKKDIKRMRKYIQELQNIQAKLDNHTVSFIDTVSSCDNTGKANDASCSHDFKHSHWFEAMSHLIESTQSLAKLMYDFTISQAERQQQEREQRMFFSTVSSRVCIPSLCQNQSSFGLDTSSFLQLFTYVFTCKDKRNIDNL
jgi:hypothetical protein